MDLTNGQACRILANAQNRENLEINNKSRTKRNGKKTSFEFKIFVISQINSGQISTNFASKKYDISRSTIDYWRKKLSNYTSKSKAMSKELEIKKLKEKLQELEWIKDFQQDVIVELSEALSRTP